MRTRTARITASVVGISALVIIAVGPALYWQEIQVQYHLYRLQNEPGYLKEAVETPEDDSQSVAVTKYLDTANGKRRLFEVYLAVHGSHISQLAAVVSQSAENFGVLGVRRSDQRFSTFQVIRLRAARRLPLLVAVETTSALKRSMQARVSHLLGGSYHWTRFQGLVFSFEEIPERRTTWQANSRRSATRTARDVLSRDIKGIALIVKRTAHSN